MAKFDVQSSGESYMEAPEFLTHRSKEARTPKPSSIPSVVSTELRPVTDTETGQWPSFNIVGIGIS